MADLTTLLVSWIQLLVPQPCFDEYFVKYNFFHGECFKVVISKCLGYGIIAGSCLVKVPQIVKIWSAKSGQGLSVIAITLEIFAVTASLAYGYASGFPFSAYGEAGFLLFQTVCIVFLVLYFAGSLGGAVMYLSVLAAILAYLMSGAAPMNLLWFLQAGVIPVIALSKLIQASANYRNGSTGQLSAITVFMLFAGSIARVFTSWQETGDSVIIATYVVSTVSNGLIAFQMLYYWNVTKKELSKKAK